MSIALAERADGIFGTDIAAIVGLSKWKRPIDIYCEKLGLKDRPPETEAMAWGKRLEALVLDEYERRTGNRTVRGLTVMAHPKRPWMRGTPDAFVAPTLKGTPEIGVEAKTTKWGFDFGDEGSDDVPDDYLCQVQWYAEITGFPLWDLAALVGGNEFRIYRIVHDPEFCELLVDAGERFLRDHIEKRVPPPLDGSPSAMEYLNRKYGRHDDRLLKATPEISLIAHSMHEAEIERDQADERFQGYKQQICSVIGEAAGLEGEDFKITWKSTKAGKRIDYEKLARNIHLAYAQLPGASWTFDEFAAECAESKPGYRRFYQKWRDDK